MSSPKAVEFSSLLADCSLTSDDVESCGEFCVELSGVEKFCFALFLQNECEEEI